MPFPFSFSIFPSPSNPYVTSFNSSFPLALPLLTILAFSTSLSSLSLAGVSTPRVLSAPHNDWAIDDDKTFSQFFTMSDATIHTLKRLTLLTSHLTVAAYLLHPSRPITLLLAAGIVWTSAPITVIADLTITPDMNIFHVPLPYTYEEEEPLRPSRATTQAVRTWRKIHMVRMACTFTSMILVGWNVVSFIKGQTQTLLQGQGQCVQCAQRKNLEGDKAVGGGGGNEPQKSLPPPPSSSSSSSS